MVALELRDMNINPLTYRKAYWWVTLCITIIIPLTLHAEEPQHPDANKHMTHAPKINFTTLRDPFSSYLTGVNNRYADLMSGKNSRHRKREKLEQYDLSSLTLVAIFTIHGQRVAMIQDSTKQGFIVRVGNYLGKHNGKIDRITGDSLVLIEHVFTPAGKIVSQPVTMTLKEVND